MPDVILIHGALGAADQLEPLAAALGGDATLHLVELEGHGSTPAAGPYSTKSFAAHVRAFMTEKGIEGASLFGYSMGGYVALALAAESPALVARVATLGTKLGWSPDVAKKETSRLHAPTIREKVPRFAELLEKRHERSGGWELMLSRTADYMTALGRRTDLDFATLMRIGQPVRFMVGDRDAVVTIDETRDGAQAAGKGELAVLPNTTHPFEQVRLPLLAAHLREFFDAV